MADLDDFFAKKDKKKSKTAKPKFLTADKLVKNLEEKREAAAAAKAKSQKEEAANNALAASTIVEDVNQPEKIEEQPEPVAEVVEEEWKEFEEEQRKDYSGLKIGQLTVNDDDDESQTDEEEEEADSDGNANVNLENLKHTGGGPWKKVIPAEEVTQIPMEVEKPSSKVYISPALRHSQALVPGSARTKPRNKTAPDITNADYFPTLGAARPEEQRKKKNEPAFEEVRHGGRVQRVQEQPTTATPATASNRFQSLDEEDES